MRNFIAKLQQIFSIDELRGRILLTIGLIAIYRLGRYITLPGIDGAALEVQMQGGNNSLLGLVNMFSGGSFSYAAVFALGIPLPDFRKKDKADNNG
jgi:preprotein translocase subunit SecY